MDRRHFVAGGGATIVSGPAQASVRVDRFWSERFPEAASSSSMVRTV